MAFELPRLTGTPEKSIVVETRAGRPILNSQAPTPNARQQSDYANLRAKHQLWRNRKPATGFYNCLGLAWLERRSAIYLESEVQKILEDDGYRQLGSLNDVRPGDLVRYHDKNGTLHVAVVLELRSAPRARGLWVLSK